MARGGNGPLNGQYLDQAPSRHTAPGGLCSSHPFRSEIEYGTIHGQTETRRGKKPSKTGPGFQRLITELVILQCER